MKILALLFSIFLSISLFAQKKVIDHTAYDQWKTLKSEQISKDGNYLSYEITPHKGDGFLYIYNKETNAVDSFPRATGAKFSGNSNYVVFRIKPGYDTLRTCELEKINKKKWPKDSIGIYLMKEDTLIKFPKIKSFEVNEESDYVAMLFDHNNPTIEVKEKRIWCKKKREALAYKSTGTLLQLFSYSNGKFDLSFEQKDVKSFELSEFANQLAYTTHKKQKDDSIYLSIVNTKDLSKIKIEDARTSIEKLKFNHQEDQLVYLATSDTAAKAKNYQLELFSFDKNVVTILADSNSVVIADSQAVSINFAPFFTKDGQHIYFGVADRVEPEPKDTLVADEKVKLDLWHYQDKSLQPRQLIQLKREERKTDLYAYNFADKSMVKLGDDTLSIYPVYDLKGEYLIAESREQYEGKDNWVSPWPSDFYRVSLKTGEAELLKKKALFGVDLAPSGNQMVYFEDGNYIHKDLTDGSEDCFTCEMSDVTWTVDMNGQPMKAYPEGVIGWSPKENLTYIQSRYDIWQYNNVTGNITSVTNQEGKANSIEYRPDFYNADSVYVDLSNMYILGFNTKTKATHVMNLVDHKGHTDIKNLGEFDAKVFRVKRSHDLSTYSFRRMTFQDYPDLFIHNGDYTDNKQVTVTNPQQDEYKWGTVESVYWTSYDGIELEGLLYKPEDFDPSKKYPMLVYYYELYSDRYHQHYIPKPTASIIYATEYTSADYVVFIPNIRYKPGHPAQSAYDCIMSGTDHVLNLYPNIDSTRMGLQGQSWGGYQTAQMVTMTDRYAAAMAGAPVSNMFSAYGGIRWGSGMNRQFQYERTQSRIGATIWDAPELYIENSPIFHIPNISTPLLIMHNDGDGAVPWYQGIEMFTAMKRLNKPVWMLNYNDDEHNLMRNANRIDLSIRMRAFFDYYLQGQEAPQWLIDGIPAKVKGIEMRY